MKNIKFTIDLELENLEAHVDMLIKRSKRELYQEGSGEYGLTCCGAQIILQKLPLIINNFIDKIFKDHHFIISKKDLDKLHGYIERLQNNILKLTRPNNLEIDGRCTSDHQLVDDLYHQEYKNYKKEFKGKIKIIQQRIDNNYIKYKKEQKRYQFWTPLIVSILASIIGIFIK